ncbi:pentatricopeptide repeat-containing protein [Striga asiatica]|uniref:Pentatricopeptide repeat-containing protein n=1 Tax=Striga asiatica TaxID=4170 RepID=A0A5A7QIL9_STRAF|nr:pentatricopeptide repeat-containing protein [Striga asiatica]
MRLAIKPFKPSRAAGLRHFSADPQPSPPAPQPPQLPCEVSKVVSILQTTDPSSWPTNPNLNSLLSSLPPLSIFKIARHLPDHQNALRFFNHLRTSPNLSASAPLAFQAALELAARENPNSPAKLHELFLQSKDQNTPLSINAGTLLIRSFSRAGMLDEMVAAFEAVNEEKKNTHVLNLVINGLLDWGRVDDAHKLLDQMFEADSKYPPNPNTMGTIFSSILKRNWCGRSIADEEIYNLVTRFSKSGIVPGGFLLTQMVMRFCSNGYCDWAWDVLHLGMNSGADIEVASCNALLTGLGKIHDFPRMNQLMEEMKEKKIQPSIITYGITIKHLCRFRRMDEALEIFEKMKGGEFGVEPDTVIYNTIIDGLCKIGRQEEAHQLMEKMMLDSKCKPNTITYNCLIDGLCKAGEIEKGQDLFERMGREGVEPNIITVNTLIDGMCKHGMVGTALEFFNEMQEKGLKGNVITYTNLITAFCNANNIERAMSLFDEMRANGCPPDAIVYQALISGLAQVGRMDDATRVLSEMRKAGFRLDVVGYNILIGGFCRKNKLDRASELLKDMESSGLRPDRVTYNTLFSFFCSHGEFAQAHRVIKKMTENGLTPTVVTYGALIHAYCSHDNLNAAMQIFRDISSSSKVPPNTVIYNMLIDVLCKSDDVEGAMSLMEDMEIKGVRPNSNTYNALFKGLRQRNWFEKALEYMEQMSKQGLDPDYVTMEILTEWLSAVGETEKLKEFVKGGRDSGFAT